jgi:hypothetical protein
MSKVPAYANFYLLNKYKSAYFFLIILTLEHALSPQIAMSAMGFDPGTTALPTELKEITINAVIRGGYEPTTVPITLGRGEFPLQYKWPAKLCTINE